MATTQLGLGNSYGTATPVPAAWFNGVSDLLEALFTAAYGLLSKSVAGSADVTLTADEAANGVLVLTGVLTGSISLIVPLTASVGGLTVNPRWVVYNGTSGAFTLTVKGATGTGIVVGQGKHAMVRSDSVNVVRVTADV